MLPIVAIEVPAALAPALAATASWSCEYAIGPGRCPLARRLTAPVDVAWYAIVSSDPNEPSKLRVEFRHSSSTGILLVERTLAFSDADPPESRWASVGLVIAGLVAAEDAASHELASHSGSQSSRRARVSARSSAIPRADTWWWGVDAGALGGQGLQNGGYRLGAFARTWIVGASRVVGAMTVRHSELSGDVSLSWWSLSIGVGARFTPERALLGAELVGDLVAESVRVSAAEPATSRGDDGSQTRVGGRIGVNVSLKFAKGLRLLFGSDVSALTPTVGIELKSKLVGREPPIRVAFSGGLRFDL